MTAGVFQAVALCLDYPDEAWREQLPLLEQVAGQLPELSLGRFVRRAAESDPAALTSHYVETFDLRRRCCLYLTYYTYGDTRDRGMALLQFGSAYRAAGFTVTSGELPDHLAVVCEFAAHRPQAGLRLLQRHRVGVDLLSVALREAGSPYLDVVETLRAVLPAATEDELERAMDLARNGPPAEEVGLEPFGVSEPTGARR